jgi:hypothetical protein
MAEIVKKIIQEMDTVVSSVVSARRVPASRSGSIGRRTYKNEVTEDPSRTLESVIVLPITNSQKTTFLLIIKPVLSSAMSRLICLFSTLLSLIPCKDLMSSAISIPV